MANEKKKTAATILADYRYARDSKSSWIKAARCDYEFALGKQWKDEDVEKLSEAAVKPLTINKIQPMVFMCSGIQRQNRGDFKVFPVGDEDETTSDIVNRLVKNVMETSEGYYKLSEMFEDGIICGEGWIEPYIDYTNDLLNGELRFAKAEPFNIYPDPKAKEYSLSDARFVIKITTDLTKDELLTLFPDKKKELENIGAGDIDNYLETEVSAEKTIENPADEYDLLEYYYKNYITKWFIVDKEFGSVKECKDKEEGEAYIHKKRLLQRDRFYNEKMAQVLSQAGDLIGDINFLEAAKKAIEQEIAGMQFEDLAVLIQKLVPEIRTAAVVGGRLIDDSVAWCYPRWKHYPFIPFYAHRTTTHINPKELAVKGIVRDLIDPQTELNKRRTQELRILNSTANSGWLVEEGAWVDTESVRKYGSSPGVNLEYKKGSAVPQRISPHGLSQGHAHLVAQNTQDLREISGINTDLLAMAEHQASGRAIALRQKQGLVMVQKMFDNYARTQKLLLTFIITQLSEVFSVEKVIRLLGKTYIQTNFQKPVLVIQQNPQTGQPEQAPQLDEAGNLVMEPDMQMAEININELLNNAELGKFDIAMGEGVYSESTKVGNYLMLMELVERGIPIPPDVLVDESNLSADAKVKIKKNIEEAQAVAARQQKEMLVQQQQAEAQQQQVELAKAQAPK